ncbi:MAG: cytidylate kinase-like family protein [Deltaproteobacteria bacterium]|nr:MAG: cytidylate kinase-like family protein [Deltaproteobacteria bacterium]
MAVITISRKYASGGRRIGKYVANRLNYEYVDKALFQKIAEKLHVSEGTLSSFETGRQYRISNQFSKFFSKNYIQRIVGYDRTVVEEPEYKEALRNLVLGVAARDNVVIIGRAAHFFLKDMENCYRFHLLASDAWRSEYAIQRLGVRRSRVEQILEDRDINHTWFLRTVSGEAAEEPHLFHLILNMDLIPIEKATDLVLKSVEE